MDQKFSNELSNAELERLAVLSEELGEAQQVIGKIIRHGYESYNPVIVTGRSNRQDLERELGDIQAAVSMMDTAGDIDAHELEVRSRAKRLSIGRWLHHQEAHESGAGRKVG